MIAPGFFVWNSEVVRYCRKHTAKVVDALDDIQSIIGRLIRSRDQRRDAFVKSMEKALTTSLGSDSEEATKALSRHGISLNLIKSAIGMIAANGGKFTVFHAVDALTRLTGRLTNAGDRIEQDARIGALLTLAV